MELSNNPSSISESLIGGYQERKRRNQFGIGLNYFKLLFKLRTHDKIYLTMFIIACAIFLLGKDTNKAEGQTFYEYQNLSFFSSYPYSDGPSEFLFHNSAEYYIAANDNNFTRFFLQSFMDPKNKVIKEWTTEEAISRRISELEKNKSYGFSFPDNVLSSGNVIKPSFFRSESSYYRPMYMNQIMDGILSYRKINVSIKATHQSIRQAKNSPNYYIGTGLSISTNMCIMLLIWSYVLQIIEFQEQRLHLLLKISGIHEQTIWITTFLYDFIVFLVFALYQSICMHFYEFSRGSSISLLTILFLAEILSVYFFTICFSLILGKAKHFKYVVSILIGLSVVLPAVLLVSNERANKNSLKMILVFAPQSAITYIYQNIALLSPNLKVLNWENLKHSMILDTDIILIYLLISMLTYVFLFLVIILFKNREIGTAPIGWRNIFRLNAWKRLFVNTTLQIFNDYDSKFIEVKDISKTFYGQITTHALDNISFEIDKGESIILIGPNGCGKSTLLNAMTGTISADDGELYINRKKSVIGFSILQDMIGICFQDNVFFTSLSVKEHLLFFASIRGQGTEEAYSQIESLLSGLNLIGSKNTAAGNLSGGQKRKLCIALAFMGSPQLVILDEPTAGVDANARQTIWKSISQFKDCTSLISSHSLEEAESISSRLFVMKNGQMVFMGTSSDLRRQYKCGYRLSLIGENPNIDVFLEYTNKFIPESTKDADRNDSILVPVDDRFVTLIEDIESKLSLFNATSMNITVEGLEHVLLRLIDD